MDTLPTDIIRKIAEYDPSMAYACYPVIAPRPTKSLVEFCIDNNKFELFKEIFARVEYSEHESRNLLTKVVKDQKLPFADRIFGRFPHVDVLTACIPYVSYDGDVTFVKWMVSNGATITNEVVPITVREGHIDLTAYYLSFWNIDPSVRQNEAFWIAFDRRHEEMTWMLYDHYKVNVNMSPSDLREVFEVM